MSARECPVLLCRLSLQWGGSLADESPALRRDLQALGIDVKDLDAVIGAPGGRAVTGAADQLFLSGSDEAPEASWKMIEESFRALARGKKKRPATLDRLSWVRVKLSTLF